MLKILLLYLSCRQENTIEVAILKVDKKNLIVTIAIPKVDKKNLIITKEI